MRLLRFALYAVLAMAALLSGAHAEQIPVPELKAWVTDQTGTLDAPAKASLEKKLSVLDESKGAQMAVLVIQNTCEDRSAARRVGQECVGRCRSRWSPDR